MHPAHYCHVTAQLNAHLADQEAAEAEEIRLEQLMEEYAEDEAWEQLQNEKECHACRRAHGGVCHDVC